MSESLGTRLRSWLKHYSEPFQDWYTNHIHSTAIQEMRNSHLPGAGDGPADAFRHILRAAEMKRQGIPGTELFLNFREGPWSSTDSAMDRHNNRIGFAIGTYVKTNGGSHEDVKQLTTLAIRKLLDGQDPAHIQAGPDFTLHADGFLTRGRLSLTDTLTIESPAIFPSSHWYQTPQMTPSQPVTAPADAPSVEVPHTPASPPAHKAPPRH